MHHGGSAAAHRHLRPAEQLGFNYLEEIRPAFIDMEHMVELNAGRQPDITDAPDAW